MVFEIDRWKLDVDVAQTAAFHAVPADLPREDPMTRNFMEAVSHLPEKAASFLKQFGIRPENPAILDLTYAPSEEEILYNCLYIVRGTILEGAEPWHPTEKGGWSLTGDRMIAMSDFCHIVPEKFHPFVQPEAPEPFFIIYLWGVLPWVLDEENPFYP